MYNITRKSRNMFEVLSNEGYDNGHAHQPLAKHKHRVLTNAMGLETFDNL